MEARNCSGRGKDGWNWLDRVRQPDCKLEELATDEDDVFANVDFKLNSSLSSILHGELGRRVRLKVREAAKKKEPLSGRQILWLLYREYDVDQECLVVYNYEDIHKVVLKGSNPTEKEQNLEKFQTDWETIQKFLNQRRKKIS